MGLASLYIGVAAIFRESFGGSIYWMPLYMLLLLLLTLPSLFPSSVLHWNYMRILSYLSLAVVFFACIATLQYVDGQQTHSSETHFFQDGLRGYLLAVPSAANTLLGTEMNVFISADVDQVHY